MWIAIPTTSAHQQTGFLSATDFLIYRVGSVPNIKGHFEARVEQISLLKTMSEYFKSTQTQLVGTFVGICLVYYLFTLILPVMGKWLRMRQQKQHELARLALRKADNEAERNKLEELVACAEKRAKEAKKTQAERKAQKASASAKAEKFKMPERRAGDETQKASSNSKKVETAPAPAPAPAPTRTRARVETRRSAPAPAAAANPWASFPVSQGQSVPSSSSSSFAFRREREEQDREYMESLQADEEKKRIEKDEEDRKWEEDKITETLRESVAALVPAEPSESDLEAVMISFRIMGMGVKDKIRFSRRFRASETINDVLNFWRAHALVDTEFMNDVEICSCHPIKPLPTGSPLRFYHRDVVIVRVNT